MVMIAGAFTAAWESQSLQALQGWQNRHWQRYSFAVIVAIIIAFLVTDGRKQGLSRTREFRDASALRSVEHDMALGL